MTTIILIVGAVVGIAVLLLTCLFSRFNSDEQSFRDKEKELMIRHLERVNKK